MPKGDGKTLESLYLELGLDLSRLQADILAADRTVTENLGRLNREKNTIKLRVEADVAALDRVKDAASILEIQERGLNQQLALSRDKLAILEAAYKQVAANSNSTSLAVQNAEKAFLKEKIAVGQLEAQLKSLSAQKIFVDTSQLQEKFSQLNSKIQYVRIKADIDVSKLKDAGSIFDAQKVHIAAVTKELELQRQKLIQLRESMYQSAKNTGGDSVQTLNIKSNVLQQIKEISRLETRLKELRGMNINLQIRADSIKQAEQTISENIARINAKIENIRVKTDIDVSRLGAAASEFDKAKAHVQGLNRELDLQNQKLAELKKALGSSVSANGLNNVKTINLQTELQKQIQAIDQLKAKINELNKIEPPKTNSLLSGYLNIKGGVAGKLNQISSSFYGIREASHSADAAITKSLEIIGAIPHPAGKAVAALAAIPLVIKGVENSLLEMAKPAIAGGDSFYVMSRGMQLSVADMGKLSTIAKVTGIDISEVTNSLRRFSMQMTKAGEKNNLAAQTVKRYGAEIFDANGRIKNAIELSAELGKALKAAQAEGNGAAFRDLVGGKFWSGDFITYLEDFADNVEQAKKVVKSGLSNPTWAHSIQGEINTLNAQTAQLGVAFSAALMPVVAEFVPKMTEQFGELVKVIAANKENVKLLGEAMALPVRVFHELTGGVISLSQAIDAAKDKGTTLGKVFAQYGEYRDDVAALMSVAPLTALTAMVVPAKGTTDLAIAAYREEIDEYKKAQAEAEAAAKAKNEEKQAQMANAFGLSGLTIEQSQKLEGAETRLNEEKIKREQETADIVYKLNHTSYENRLRDLENFKNEELNKIRETEELIKNVTGQDKPLDDARFALFENVAAKQMQIEDEREARLDEIRQRIAAADQTEFEKRIASIEKEKESWIQAGMERAEAEQLAEQQKADYVRNIEQELSSNINSLHQSDLERQLARIEQEKQAWIDNGASEVQVEQLAQAQRAQAYRNQEKILNEIRDSVASLDRTALENTLANIEKERQSWIQKGMDEIEAEELAQKKMAHAYEETLEQERDAAEKNSKAIAQAYQDAAKKRQAAEEEAERKNKALREEALNVLKQEADEFATFLKEGYAGLEKLMKDKLIKSGVDPELLKEMTPEKLEAYKSAREDAQRSFLPNWKDPYSAEIQKVKLPENLNKTSQAANDAAKSLDVLSKSALNAAGRGEQDFSERTENVATESKPLRVYTRPDGSTEITNFKGTGEAATMSNDFSVVAKEAEQSLKSFSEQTQRAAEEIAAPQSENYNSMPADAYQPVYAEAPAEITSVINSFGELTTVVQGVSANLSSMAAPEYAATENPFSYIEPELQSFIQTFSIMGTSAGEVTVRLSELSAAIERFSLQQENSSPTETRQPVNVNTSVSIEEAHAWDYDHIQELADMVAIQIHIKIGEVETLHTEDWGAVPDDRQTRIETIGGTVVQDFGGNNGGDTYSCKVTVETAAAQILSGYAYDRQFVTVRDVSGRELPNLRVVIKKYGYVERFEKNYYWAELEFWEV